MDRRFIEINKNVIIKTQLTGLDKYYFRIDTITWIPDEVIVKFICYNQGGVFEDQINYIYTNLISDTLGIFLNNIGSDQVFEADDPDTLISVGESTITNPILYPDTHFILRKPVNGTYEYNIVDVNNNIQDFLIGELCIGLEFVKYRTDLPDIKIY
ncbi:MAG: hypothetical protein ABI091_12985 [Ferruginibacter sp.]